ncbi:MAG: hypothetical protein ABIG10_00720 [bacterium]
MINTKKNTILRFFIYYDEKEKEFIGVCVDLAIIKVGNDPRKVKDDLINASFGYAEAVCNQNLPDKLLNHKLPKEYLDVHNFICNAISKKQLKEFKVDLNNIETFFQKVPEICHAI